VRCFTFEPLRALVARPQQCSNDAQVSANRNSSRVVNLMFSTCRSLQTGLILLALGACSKEPAPPAQTPSTPLVAVAPQAPQTQAVVETLEAHIKTAGATANYRATFQDNERVRIAEQRAGGSHNGLYEFRGARLLHYSGDGLWTTTKIELEFDLNGALKSAKADVGTVPAEEISALRERAQLLRSHALAHRSTRDHH
jgi:hypothetical protein